MKIDEAQTPQPNTAFNEARGIIAREVGQYLPQPKDGSDSIDGLTLAWDILTALSERGYVIEQGWQPIETAPKSADIPILSRRSGDFQAVAIYFPHGGAEWCCVDGAHLLNVTHWRPLPDPPVTQEPDSQKGGE